MARFVHAADLHLGNAQFDSLERASDFLDSLKFVLDSAKQRQAEFILLCGDLFDSLELIPYIYGNILQLIDAFYLGTEHKIPIIAIEGNHDKRKFAKGTRYDSSHSWIQNLALSNHIILLDNPDYEENRNILIDYDKNTKMGNVITINETEIIGIGYAGEEPVNEINRIIYELNQRPRAKYRILMMHMGVKGYLPGIPALSYKVFEDLHQHIDYFALGHFHIQFEIENWVFNPGACEPVHYSERNFKRGVFFCEAREIEDQESKAERKMKNSVECLKKPNRPLIYLELDSGTIDDEDCLVRICNNRISRECSEKKALIYVKLRNALRNSKLKTKNAYLNDIRMKIIQKCEIMNLIFLKSTQSNEEELVRTLTDYL